MKWTDIIKRNMTNDEAREKAHEIMIERYGKAYEKATESISPRHTKYGNEYMFLVKLMGAKGMHPDMAAKQPFVPRKAEEEDYF